MRQILERLLVLQKFQLQTKALSLKDEAEILALREKVPEPIMGHFDRFIAGGKRGVAIARDGVCSECHLRVTSGTLASLAYTTEIHLCDNCGRYLYLPENERLGLADSPAPPKAQDNHPPNEPQRKPPCMPASHRQESEHYDDLGRFH